jgi:bacteriocin biosynthesis cyclodehydratase domain-containing protein
VLVRLRPGLRQVWRGPQTLQIGLTPGRAAVLDGLTPDDAALIESLSVGLDLTALDAGRVPPGPSRGREILRLLGETGVLLTARSARAALARLGPARDRLAPDAAAWALTTADAGDGWDLLAARCDRLVQVRGTGRTASAVATSLAAAGVAVVVEASGTVSPADVCPLGPGPDEVGERREDVAARRIRLARGLTAAQARADGRPDVVVLVDALAADSAAACELHEAETSHLSVVVRESDVVIGPLVRPGQGPCLHCLDLHRGDRDPRWAHVLAQLLAAPRPAGVGPTTTEEVTLSTVAGGLAALQVLAELDRHAEPASLGATLEVELPDGLVCRRPWPVHSACGCSALPEKLPPVGFSSSGPGSGARALPQVDRMTP